MKPLDLFSTRRRELHPERWQPDERDNPRIVAQLRDNYDCTCDMCGADSEEAAEAFKLYMTFRNSELSVCKDDIQGFFADCYWSVEGDIEKYYAENSELIGIINLVLCPEWVEERIQG